MKLLKRLLKILIVLVLIIIVAAIVFLAIISDNSKSDYKPLEEDVSIESVLGRCIYESLEDISKLDKSELDEGNKNNISIDFTYQNLNDCATNIIRNSVPNYLKDGGQTTIVSSGAASLNSITFQEIDGKFGLVARGSALGFYNTSISLKCSNNPYILDNVLYLQLGEFKLGNKISISADFVKDNINRFGLFKDSSNDYFDVQNLTLHLDINKELKKYSSSTRFNDFLGNVSFDASYTSGDNACLSLLVNTKDIFINYSPIPETPSSYVINPLEILSGIGEHSLIISEENFNYLIKKEFDKNSYELEPISLGGYDFTFALDNFYFDVNATNSKSSVLAEVALNNCKTLCEASVSHTLIKNKGEVEKLVLGVDTFKLGNVEVSNDNFFQSIEIDEDTLTQGHSDILKVTDVIFDYETGQVKVVYAGRL